MMSRRRPVLALVTITALFGLLIPSSVGGVISRPLLLLSTAATGGLMALLVVMARRLAPPLHVAINLGVLALLAVFSITSPFAGYSPGVVVLYATVVVLFCLDLRALRSRWIDVAFGLVTVAGLVLGAALALDVAAADRLTLAWYSAFYDELVPNMVLRDNKPVLSFATHSTAGFMLYLMFYMHWYGFRHAGGWWRAGSALGFMALLAALNSTTGLAFLVVAAGQVALEGFRVVAPRFRGLAVAAGLAVMLAGVAVVPISVDSVLARASAAVVGDRISGLASRYAAGGLLAGNFAFMMRAPLTPIGFGASDTLYLGDSGVIVNLVRGSVMLLVAIYLSYALFLRFNLVDPRCALVLWLATVAFEIGFTPMMYFRFVAFLPFMVVYLNTVASDTDRASVAGAPGAVSA